MKQENLFTVLLIVSVATLIAVSFLKPINVNLYSRDIEREKTIDVSGTSTISSNPDKVDVILGVETREKNALDSQQRNAEMMKSVMDSLRSLEIGKKDIQTTRYSLEIVREYDEERKTYDVVGYKTVNMIKVTSMDIDMAGKIIDAASDSGANRIDFVQFGLTEQKLSEVKKQALKEASSDAKEKAEAIASESGVRIKRVIRLAESNYFVPYMDYSLKLESGGFSTEISPGEVRVSATISASYEIE